MLGLQIGLAALGLAARLSAPAPPWPRLSLEDASVAEGSGHTSLVFRATLSAPSSVAIRANYAPSNGSATAGSDYVAAAGTFTIPAGATSATFTIEVLGDTAVEPDETLTVAIRRFSRFVTVGRRTAVGTILNDDPPAPLGHGLDDTGVTTCATASAGGLPCNSAIAGTDQFPGQDAESGRDATANDDSDGHAGFVFVKRDAAGLPLPDQQPPYSVVPWACVEDRVTGLFWEVRPDDGGLRDRDWRYSWYDSSGVGGLFGRSNRGTCVDTVNCDTEKYAAAVNAGGLCGFADWRLPTRSELLSLVDYGAAAAPLLDAAFLPDGISSAYWTSARDTFKGPWSVDFSDGTSLASNPVDARPVRLVRGE